MTCQFSAYDFATPIHQVGVYLWLKVNKIKQVLTVFGKNSKIE